MSPTAGEGQGPHRIEGGGPRDLRGFQNGAQGSRHAEHQSGGAIRLPDESSRCG